MRRNPKGRENGIFTPMHFSPFKNSNFINLPLLDFQTTRCFHMQLKNVKTKYKTRKIRDLQIIVDFVYIDRKSIFGVGSPQCQALTLTKQIVL